MRVVNYVADEHGFRAAVQSNEPGVAPEDPAATTINKAPVAIPYAAPMHLDHVTGINVGLAHSVAAPVLGAYSAPVPHISAPVVAPVGYHRQPMHFASVLGPSVSGLIGSMPAHIGSYIASQAALHPLQKAVAYNAPIAAAAPVAAAYAPVTSAYAQVAAAPAIPAAPVVYKAPAHFGTVIGPSVDHMLNHYVPQHIAAQKFYRSLHSPAVHYQEAPVVSSTLKVAPAAPVASAVVAPVAAAPIASYAAAPVASYGASYAAAPVASYAAAPVAKYAAPIAQYAAAPLAQYAAAPVAKYAAPVAAAYGAPVASYAAAAPVAAYATGTPVARYAAAAPVASYAPSVSYASAPIASYGVSAAPVTPVIGKSVAYTTAPAIVQGQYASAAYAAPVVEKQVAYGPAAVGYGPASVAYAAAPAVAKVNMWSFC